MDESNGKDVHSHRMNGVIGVIKHIDDIGQIHLEGYGLSVIPEIDEFEILES